VEEKPKKIGIVMVFLLMYFSICADLIQFGLTFVPAAGQIINTIASVAIGLMFFIWFRILGVKFSLIKDPKKMVGIIAGPIIELVPFLQALPGWTLAILLTIFSVNTGIDLKIKPPSVKETVKVVKTTK